MSTNADFCQIERLHTGSQPVSPIIVFGSRMRWRIKQRGFWTTVQRACVFLLKRVGLSGAAPSVAPVNASTPKPAFRETLDLSPGEWVEVKSEAEIRETLDELGRHRGMLFMPEMAKYCGQKLRVMKRVEQMLLESTMQVRRMRDTVLLEGCMCDGVGLPCHRSCFFFWREAWLQRTTPVETGTRAKSTSPESPSLRVN